ncbi:MAG: Signal transduction histidine kinase [Marmoricola sp.]|nr:Signal transduction histidine kinase [Marmoricola sp.]
MLVTVRPIPWPGADWRSWAPDATLGLVVLVVGVIEIHRAGLTHDHPPLFWIVAATAVAVGLSRRLPLVSLLLIWVFYAYQVSQPYPILYVQLSVVVVSFGCACWGHPVTVFLSGLSIPAAGVIAVIFAGSDLFRVASYLSQYRQVIDAVQQVSGSWRLGALILGTVLLGVPWLAGLTVRFSRYAAESHDSQQAAEEHAARAQRESEQAHEIARLREEQAKLAHDVHDVVGHSLAVILAQAESAQFLDEADSVALKQSMANIASSARTSLRDVRQVLTPTSEAAADATPGALTDLVEGVRDAGHQLTFSATGVERPLPPDRATVAYRVLQEMLTNAIRHGSRDQPLRVALDWGDELRIEVANLVGPNEAGVVPGGQGLDGMRRRLESVGGTLQVGTTSNIFTTTASIPVRSR